MMSIDPSWVWRHPLLANLDPDAERRIVAVGSWASTQTDHFWGVVAFLNLREKRLVQSPFDSLVPLARFLVCFRILYPWYMLGLEGDLMDPTYFPYLQRQLLELSRFGSPTFVYICHRNGVVHLNKGIALVQFPRLEKRQDGQLGCFQLH